VQYPPVRTSHSVNNIYIYAFLYILQWEPWGFTFIIKSKQAFAPKYQSPDKTTISQKTSALSTINVLTNTSNILKFYKCFIVHFTYRLQYIQVKYKNTKRKYATEAFKHLLWQCQNQKYLH
jgi:hypothetical protein